MRRADRLFQIVQYLRGGRLLTAAQLAERRYAPPETALVRLRTDDGVTGLGEGATLPHYFNQPLGGLIDWLERLRPTLIGVDPLDLVGVHRAMDPSSLLVWPSTVGASSSPLGTTLTSGAAT